MMLKFRIEESVKLQQIKGRRELKKKLKYLCEITVKNYVPITEH